MHQVEAANQSLFALEDRTEIDDDWVCGRFRGWTSRNLNLNLADGSIEPLKDRRGHV